MGLDVVELFAGVGGFRLGLEGPPHSSRDSSFKVVWSNQWEPTTKVQHAAEVYTSRWNLEPIRGRDRWYSSGDDDVFVNEDIGLIDVKDIPEHDILVGGFPCQDYSVAKTLDKATGLRGKKGVLWWEIDRIVRHHKPKMILLENVDRLIKSPVKQRGRDFAVMLACLDELDYVVEWRVINAADYGMPQRRRRVFICAYGPGTKTHTALKSGHCPIEWLTSDGVGAKAFPVSKIKECYSNQKLKSKKNDKLSSLSDYFNKSGLPGNKSPFLTSGILVDNRYYTAALTPDSREDNVTLGDIVFPSSKVGDEFFLTPDSLVAKKGWIYLKGAKREARKGRDGFTYSYNEGPVNFPDPLNKPSRTIITGEGGKGASRFKHVVKVKIGKKRSSILGLDSKKSDSIRKTLNLKKDEWLRRLTPEELELLNMFPEGHTRGQSDGKRAFFMGNALVVGIIERFAKQISILESKIPS